MSIVRFGDDSDVYIYECGAEERQNEDWFVCSGCLLGVFHPYEGGPYVAPGEGYHESYETTRVAEMIGHIKFHRAQGHRVPARAELRLLEILDART